MSYRWYRLHRHVLTWRNLCSEEVVALLLVLLVFVSPAAASTRFEQRGLFMKSSLPGVTTQYTLSLHFMSPQPVGSLDMLFCVNPIPYLPCETPPGLDVSHAVLSQQSGEGGFSILKQTTNHIVLTRMPSMITSGAPSSYTFDHIVNPTDTTRAFSIRLRSHSSTDASGPQIDFGSVRGQVTNAIQLQTQVPPMLMFCVARQVAENCATTDDVYYHDMGTLSPTTTLTAQSQMAVGTNASAGFAIIVGGTSPAAGTNVIPALSEPTASQPGTDQFGINLVANTDPAIGDDPEGPFANAVTTPDYGQPNKYKYVPGDVVAYSPNVSLMRRFTVSYILNSSPDLKAGVYTTTITYVASGRF